MAAQTEAACLLETGALYQQRMLLQPAHGDPVFAGFKTGAFSLYYGDAPIYHFDLEGRWQRAYVDGLHYLKGLDGTVQTIDRVREGTNLVLKRRTLGFAEASDCDAAVRDRAIALLDGLGTGALARMAPPECAEPVAEDELRSLLERVAAWDTAAWFAHRERYLATYGPLPFLPPDCPHAVILQATLGHAHGRAFGLGAAHEHFVRTPGEVADHARAVSALLGRRVEQCKGVFLAGADALRRPDDELRTLLEIIRAAFPQAASDQPGAGVHTFWDGPFPAGRDRRGWQALAELGLRRVTLGVESGASDVRALYRAGWTGDDLRGLVATLKGAGIGVGLLVLAGAGGAEHAERHLGATIELLNSLELGAGDLVSLVDAAELTDPTPAHRLPFAPLTTKELSGQLTALKTGLAPPRSRGAKVVPYRFEKQG